MFFTKHLSKMLLATGFGTSMALFYAFWPEWAIANIGQLPFIASDIIFYQHWGIMVGLMGLLMMFVVYKPQWRDSILLYSMLEKGFLVFLVLTNLDNPNAVGFFPAAGMDAIVVMWTLAFYWEQNKSANNIK